MAACLSLQGGVKHDLVHKSTLQSRGLKLDDEEAIKAALKAVRNDSDETDWCLVHYANDSTLSLVGQGTGGPDELAANLTDEEAFYGLFRVTEQVQAAAPSRNPPSLCACLWMGGNRCLLLICFLLSRWTRV